MPITRSRSQRKILDPKQCFDLWLELGTLEKARFALFDLGVKQNLINKPPTAYGVRNAAMFWVMDNMDVAFEIMSGKLHELDRDDFDVWAVHKAMRLFYSEGKFRDWLKTNGWYESQKYRNIYDHKYPKLHTRGDQDIPEE